MILATDDATVVDAYTQFGLHLGILVQIGDDLQGVWHPLAPGDLSSGKKTLPIVYALSVGTEQEKKHLRDLLPRAVEETAAAAEIRQILGEMGAIEYLFAESEIHREHARAALPSAKDPVALLPLVSLLDEIVPHLASDQ